MRCFWRTSLGRHIVEQDDADGWNVALDGAIEADAGILPGDSGGALVDSAGEVVGIVTAILDNGGSGGVAIPIDEARLVAQEIQRSGRLTVPHRDAPADAQTREGWAATTG